MNITLSLPVLQTVKGYSVISYEYYWVGGSYYKCWHLSKTHQETDTSCILSLTTQRKFEVNSHTSFYCTSLFALHFIVLPRCFLFVCFFKYKLKVVATPYQASLLVPFFQYHLLTSCLCVIFW